MDATKVKERLELIEKTVGLKPLAEIPDATAEAIIAKALAEIDAEIAPA